MDRRNHGPAPEEVEKKLRKAIESLRTNLAIYEHNMSEALEKLKFDYGIESIEEGIETVQRIDVELQTREVELDKIAKDIDVAVRNYSNG